MKICYLGNHLPPHIKVFIDYFKNRGHEIHTFGRFNPYLDDNVYFHFLMSGKNIKFKKEEFVNKSKTISKVGNNKKNLLFKIANSGIELYDFVTIGKIIKKIKPDIIHGHEAVGWGIRTVTNKGCARLLSCWGSDINRFPWDSRLNYTKVNFALKNVDMIHVNIPTFKNRIIEKFGVDENKIKVIPWGINLDMFNFQKIDNQKIDYYKNKYGITDNDVVILYPKGFRSIEKQNYLNLLKAYVKLVKKYDNCKLILLSYGMKNGIEKVLKIINENQLNSKVILIKEMLPQEQMPYIFSISDIIAVIPDMDQLSGAILEGMLFDNIPVLSNIKPYKIYFQNEKNCYYVNQKDPDDIEKILQLCIENREEIKKSISSVNKDIIFREFDRKTQMPKIEQLYQQLIDEYSH